MLSSSKWSFFSILQGMHKNCRFSNAFMPPFDFGIIWSRCVVRRPIKIKSEPQILHRPFCFLNKAIRSSRKKGLSSCAYGIRLLRYVLNVASKSSISSYPHRIMRSMLLAMKRSMLYAEIYGEEEKSSCKGDGQSSLERSAARGAVADSEGGRRCA